MLEDSCRQGDDVWLSQLYANEIHVKGDYAAAQIQSRLQAGVTVILDFSANTRGNRRWLKDIIDAACIVHELH